MKSSGEQERGNKNLFIGKRESLEELGSDVRKRFAPR